MANEKTVGVLLDAGTLRGIRRKKTGAERIHLYNRAAKRLGINVMFSALPLIDLKKGKAKGLTFRGGRWKTVSVPIPKAIHNRTLPIDRKNKRKLNALGNKTSLFNRKNRYSKLKVNRILSGDGTLRQHVPATVSFTKPHLKDMMRKYHDLFVKPTSGSIGKGVMSLTKRTSGKWILQASRRKTAVAGRSAYGVLRRKIGNRSYLIQKGIPLAKFKGRPFDLRVAVQKGNNGNWQVTGTAGKVAGKGRRITNIGGGGRAARPEVLYRHNKWDPAQVQANVNRVSLLAAEVLGRKLKGLADIGLDVGLDQSGKPFIIEMNGRDQRYSFKKAGLHKTFYRTYETPLAYAAYRLRHRK